MKVVPCACGAIPTVHVERGGEDFMEAWAECKLCGIVSDHVEHVWGGEEAREWAVHEWNLMRTDAISRAEASR